MDDHNPEQDLFSLLQKAKQGDTQAFEKVYHEVFLPTFRYILKRVQDRTVAEDLTQTVFLKVSSSRTEVKKQSHILAYFFTIARNVVIDHWKKNARDAQFSFPLDENTTEPSLEKQNIPHDVIKAMDKNLEEVPKKILYMKFFEGYSTEEISQHFHLSPANVRQIQCRALKKLRDSLSVL